MSTTTPNLGLFKYDTTTDGNVAFNINTALNNNWDKIDEAISNSGGARNIGEIVASTVPLTDAGLHLLDGSLIQGNGIYSAFVTYIAGLDSTYPNLFVTESAWQSSVTTYGVCGKFVYDSINNTVRLPKYSDKIYTQSIKNYAHVCGNGMTLGLTNGDSLSGAATLGTDNGITQYVGSYGTQVGTTRAGTHISSDKTVGITPDGTKSGIIADLANITTALEGYYYIVVATSTKTEILVDIDEIATDLNGKADVDLSNINASSSAKKQIVEWGRNFTSVGTIIESNLTSTNTQTYDLGFTDNKVKMGHFAVYVGAVSSGGSGVCLTSDCFSNVAYTSHKTGCVLTNNGYGNASYVCIPFITEITVAVRTVTSSQVLFIGYQ